MQGTAVTEGDSGDGGDAPAESKGEFPWAAIGVPHRPLCPHCPLYGFRWLPITKDTNACGMTVIPSVFYLKSEI